MNHVLIISYYFPPLGMGGTQRMAGFARHLPAYGWQPTVLTVKEVHYYARDVSLLKGLEHCHTVRTESLDPLRLFQKMAAIRRQRQSQFAAQTAPQAGLLKRLALALSNFIFVPDNKLLWLPFSWRTAHRLLAQENHRVLLSSGPPHSVHLLAYLLKKRYHVPWVADLRDGWAGGDFQPEPTWLHRLINRKMQAHILNEADRIVVVSNGLAAQLAQERLNKQKIVVITNGFEEADFQHRPAADKCFDIVHAGTIGNFVQPEPFLHAFRDFLHETGLEPADIRLHFIGSDLTGRFLKLVDRFNLNPFVNYEGYVEHERAVRLLGQADLLLYLVSEGPFSGFIPGKTFEYLAARKPVLAVSPDIEGLKILQAHTAVRWLSPHDTDGIGLALKAFYVEFKTGKRHSMPPKNSILSFSRKTLTGRLVKLFEEIV